MAISSVTPHVRLLIARWPDDAPRGAVTAFCREHGISTSVFHKIRALARDDGIWPVLEPASRKPHTRPRETDPEVVRLALETRSGLEVLGLDFGPVSVAAKMRRMGHTPPSRATLARIFTRAGVVTPEPRKKPRAAYRRFVYPAPNCLWQIDATGWTLTRGRACTIFQIIDDHSRKALASLAATGETSQAALQVVETAIEKHGVPQKFLSDNGTAFNPTRLGYDGELVRYLRGLGVEPITGKPGKPTTQGKNERFHQTLFRYLNKQPAAETLTGLQTQLDTFDDIYNTQREHQALPAGMTPQNAWEATPKADPPTPPETTRRPDEPHRQTRRTVTARGTFRLNRARIMLGTEHAGHTIHLLYDAATIDVFDHQGTHLATLDRPDQGADWTGQPSTLF